MAAVMETIKEMASTAQRAASDHREGGLARPIEEMTAWIPSDTFLWLAGGAILGALSLRIAGRDKDANFVGQWAPTFLILGLYNKLVKQLGHDKYDRTA